MSKESESKEWGDITDAERIQRLYDAVETMAAWLVNAQTGFGKRDAEGIFEILDFGTTADGVTAEARRAEAVIQAARAYVDYPMEGTRRKALRTALAALEDVQ